MHHKNSHRQNGRPIGPYVLDRDATPDGAVFIENLTCWLEKGNQRTASAHGTPPAVHVFLDPGNGKSFTQATYRTWVKRRMKEASGIEITPNLFRHIFVDERTGEKPVAGPSNAGIAQVCRFPSSFSWMRCIFSTTPPT